MCYGNSTFNTGQRINSDGDEYNCGRNFVGCSINTNTSSNSLGITRQDNR